MSWDLTEWNKLCGIKEDTRQTVEQLHFLNEKMDKQIKLMEQMIEILSKIEGRSPYADY